MRKYVLRAIICLMVMAGLIYCGTSATTNNNGSILLTMAVTPINPSLATGANYQFSAIGTYSDNSTQNISASASWTSSDTSTATISNTGFATAIAVGSTTIKAVAGNISGTTILTVTAQQVATLVSIVVAPTNPSIAIGSTKQFTATGMYSDRTAQNLAGSTTWSSSDTSKATISNAGLATAIAEGSTTITALSGSIADTTTLTVTTQQAATLVSIVVTPTNPSVAIGETKQFTATGMYSDSTAQNLAGSTTWSSSDTSKAIISNAGLATAIAEGSTTITALSGSIADTTTLTIVTLITDNHHLWGGDGLTTYLGCLTCGNFDSDSVCNQFGTYGSSYSSSSIWNEFGTYGSPYRSYSPWNAYSSSGPGIFSSDGLTFYGYFTVNAYKANRTQNSIYLSVLDYYVSTQNLSDTRTYACGN